MSHFPSTERKRDSDSDNLPLLSRHPPSAKIGIWAAADAAVAPCVRVCMDERDTSGGQTICIAVKDYLGPPSVQDIMHVVLGEKTEMCTCGSAKKFQYTTGYFSCLAKKLRLQLPVPNLYTEATSTQGSSPNGASNNDPAPCCLPSHPLLMVPGHETIAQNSPSTDSQSHEPESRV